MPQRSTHLPSSFNNAFGIVPPAKDAWFDSRLHVDTDLFVDPFLMFNETSGPWSTVHDRLIEFFNLALMSVAKAGNDQQSAHYLRAQSMLSFPEPPAFCLGYSKKSIFGAGSARKLGLAMLASSRRAIDAGIANIEKFGDIMIFGENFGADRVGDMVCNIVMDLFVDYTQEVATTHSLPTTQVVLPHCGYDISNGRWNRRNVALPVNPCWSRPVTPVLLVPGRFLNDLPRMAGSAFWDWVYDSYNAQLRSDLNVAIGSKLSKEEIIEEAKKRPNVARRFGRKYVNEQTSPTPYDLSQDPDLKVTPLDVAQEVVRYFTAPSPTGAADFCDFVQSLIDTFKQAVEHRVTKSFWINGVPRHETHAQAIFYSSVLGLCRHLDVGVSPESDGGRGPVDFRFSTGWKNQALVELKLARNSDLLNNVRNQLPTYMKTEQIACGRLVIIQYKDSECDPAFVARVTEAAAEGMATHGVEFGVTFVDARPKPSGSKATGG